VPITTISGGYSDPIIAARTPWQSARITFPENRLDWPPVIDGERLTRYSEYEALIENRPWDVFDDLGVSADQKSKIVIAAALPELLCNVWADAVWSDPPTIELATTQQEDRWGEIDLANDWSEIGAWESVFAAAAFGHSIIRLRRDEARIERYGTDVVFEEIDPAIYFPKLRTGSSREIEYVVLAWEEDRSALDDRKTEIWQVRELHTVEDGQYRIVTQERRPRTGMLGGENAFRTVNEEAPEGVDFLPFVELHAKRWRGRYWGISELARNMSVFDEIDNTLSNIAEILEYHGKPLLQVPAEWIYGGSLVKGADRVQGVRRPELADVARYITYDGQLDAGLASLDKSIEIAFLVSEVPRAYFGMGELPAAPSGTSLKLQLQNYLKKADRWQRAETKRTRDLVEAALRLDGVTMDTKKPAKVTHGSPLPVDDEQNARIEQGLYAAGMTSLELALKKLRRVPADELDDEIAAIEDEEEAKKPELPPAILPGAPRPGGLPNPNPDPAAPPQPAE
jgi:hypothetical protein